MLSRAQPELDGGEPAPQVNGHRADASIRHLLGREVVDPLAGGLGSYVKGSTVVVTGAGGSIGSEVCRTVARLGARQLVLVEVAEGPLVEIAGILRYEDGFTRAALVLADLRRPGRALDICEQYRPDLIVHTAAYKQVPLAEVHSLEAVANNVFVTRNLVDAASRTGVRMFVSFSTDKAVDPANVLGRTKAVAEWLVRAGAGRSETRFSSVRLGNVLDSAGSILPLFRRQIARGGPITVTHPDATRYLMTTAEAAGLGIAAGGLGDYGDVFCLDMGKPVRILDVARILLSSNGRENGRAIPIEIVGLRQGEKLHEQLWEADADVVRTVHPRILRGRSGTPDVAWLAERISHLELLLSRGEETAVRAELHAMQRDARFGTAQPVAAAAPSG